MADKQDQTTLKVGSNQFDTSSVMPYLIRQSNLIEGIDDVAEDKQSLRAWKWLQNRKTIISLETVLGLHNRITINQLLATESGAVRTVNVMVGGRLCPSPYLAKQQLENWALDMIDWKNQDPITMHIRFEKIHPFIDGNGRTGRMLMWFHQQRLGQLPTAILNANKQDYYRWFK